MENQLKVSITTPSLILFLKIIKRMGLKVDDIAIKLTELMEDKETVDTDLKQEEMGLWLVNVLFEGIDKAEDLIYEFLGKIFCMEIEEAMELDFFKEVLPSIKGYDGWGYFLENAFTLGSSAK